MRMLLKRDWAVRIYEKLSGAYGSNRVSNNFSRVVDGVDLGTELTIQDIQERLGVFNDRPDAIAWMIDNLPEGKIPDVIGLYHLCKAAPRPVVAIEYKPEPADPVKVAEITRRAAAAISDTRDHMAWAKNPKSQEALDGVVSGAKTDSRLREILAGLVANGKCSSEFKLLTEYKVAA